jgi:hypothetical protein
VTREAVKVWGTEEDGQQWREWRRLKAEREDAPPTQKRTRRNMSKLYFENLNVAVLDLQSEEPTRALIQHAIDAVSGSTDVWYLKLVISPEIARTHSAMLDEFGFTQFGTLTANARTTLILRKDFKKSKDGVASSALASGGIEYTRRVA